MKTFTAGLVGLSLSLGAMAAPALAQDAHAGHAAALSAADTPIETIAATAEGKAALDKNLPGLTTHEAYEQFKGMSLKQVQPMSGGAISDDALTALQADLDKLKK
ncbi:hypothetical protein GGQ61_001085 [Phenylobacterium haematophilum]|uniref:Uncharacterized protein n=1 Tax=Phenylobacterium haematophilum TaxID=98513 RepID=A0A839ZWF0_9CAUL|nr:hypothetical protein [Phenylobacterium haematophilum]MBB3890388.1 hypothetical protein [Phenylobacterium haematophilum]